MALTPGQKTTATEQEGQPRGGPVPPPPTEDRKRVTRVLGRLRVSAGDIEPRPVLPCRHRTHVAWTVNPHVFTDTPASRGKERGTSGRRSRKQAKAPRTGRGQPERKTHRCSGLPPNAKSLLSGEHPEDSQRARPRAAENAQDTRAGQCPESGK